MNTRTGIRMTWRAIIVLLMLLARPLLAAAQSGPVYTPAALPMLPYRGMYYEPGHGGTGLTLDIDKLGYIFAVFYTYTADGAPTYLLMEGRYQPKYEMERVTTGVLGTFEATPYISENGECVGEGCSYQSPQRTLTDLHASIVWTSPRVATLTIGTQTWHLQGGQYTITDADALKGQWFFNGVNSFGGSPVAAFGSLVLSATTRPVTAADFSAFPYVSADAVIFDLVWRRIPLHSFTQDGSAFFAVYSAESGRVDIFQGVLDASGALVRSSIVPFGPMYLEGPELMRGRHELSISDKHSGDQSRYSVVTDITLTRSASVSTFMGQDDTPEDP